jgi:hypothetical protein
MRVTATARAKRGRRLVVSGAAPTGSLVTVKVLRGRRTVATRRAKAPKGTYAVTVKLRRKGSYGVQVSALANGQTVRAPSRKLLVR